MVDFTSDGTRDKIIRVVEVPGDKEEEDSCFFGVMMTKIVRNKQ